jgi:hypothetical protein
MENIAQCVDLGTSIGRSQAYGALANQCSAAQAKSLEEIWESGSYKLLGLSWDEYCQVFAGLTSKRVEGIIRNLQEFGAIYLQLNEIVAISPETYRKLQPKVQDDSLEISGEMVPIVPENAVRIRDAVSRLRAELRQARDEARKANDDVEVLTSPEISSLQARVDAWLQDIRRLAPRLAANREDAPLRGLVQYSIGHLQQIAGGFAG